MKRLLVAFILAGCTMLGACTPIDNTPVTTPTPDFTKPPVVSSPDALTPEIPDVTDTPGAEQNIEEAREDLNAMMPILDSIIRVTGTTGDNEYAPDDPEFFWRVLHIMGSSWGTTHPFVEPSDDGFITVQTRVMGDFASAAFSSYSVFPEIPENLGESIQYDAENDEYILSPCDTGGTYTYLDDVSFLQDGSVTVIVGLYDGAGNPEDLLGSVSFTLVEKPNASGNRSTNYLYSVTGATKISK